MAAITIEVIRRRVASSSEDELPPPTTACRVADGSAGAASGGRPGRTTPTGAEGAADPAAAEVGAPGTSCKGISRHLALASIASLAVAPVSTSSAMSFRYAWKSWCEMAGWWGVTTCWPTGCAAAYARIHSGTSRPASRISESLVLAQSGRCSGFSGLAWQ